jgi:2-polyprenyl-3-methyl-5-hydroxy-6-metoxy-1,4-benzoquinol methylase
MINLNKRSLQKELLDGEGIPFADIKKNMQELDTINSLLGGHAITLKGLTFFTHSNIQKISACEIGCGGGDNLRVIHNYCEKKNIALSLTGVDLKRECVTYAAERNPQLPARWVCADYKAASFETQMPDIIFSSLFCHHFTEEELVEMVLWMKANCGHGFFINDLQRHLLAYYSIKLITRLFSRSYLVKNDAPLSVARGFKKKEWQTIFAKAGIENYSIRWKWAFRHLIVFKKQQ